ncbi:hypothetical protein [Burkholderia sp. BCC0322]|uniref:hypothetical protein n=1 Tax=unclassified Burkholderia TaxID=2613784 RepID=UPI00158EC457|nr:hypothetical protein [Burkholderia sp. BCC0322]
MAQCSHRCGDGRRYSFSTDYIGANYSMGSQTAAGNDVYPHAGTNTLLVTRIGLRLKF